jgi:hypothetical protein
MPFKAEVIADSSGKFVGNSLVFATKEEAEGYARDLAGRWTLVREWRVVETAEEVNYTFLNGYASRLGTL